MGRQNKWPDTPVSRLDWRACRHAIPTRIVCLTEETTETLYLLGEERRIVGISGFTVRPPRARREKPKVSAFTSAKIDKIVELQPDLVLGFSDLQADIAAELMRAGIEVHVFNHRSVAEILRMIATLGGMVGCEAKAAALVEQLEAGLDERARAAPRASRAGRASTSRNGTSRRSPASAGCRSSIGIAGGDDCFPELARESLGKNRIIADPLEVPRRAPDVIFGSWCGKKFRPEHVAARAGWGEVPAVRDGHLYEIKSSIILQPGPAALTDGLRETARAHLASVG